MMNKIKKELGKVRHGDTKQVNLISKKIRELIAAASFPEKIAKEIESQFLKLKSTYVAVRSSATAEDSTQASWAGELESYLNTTKKNLLDNVKKCWSSLYTPRAIFYRFEKKLDKDKISVAVVVQKMVDSEKSGIAFSVHPVTQDKNQIIIEAGFGLGEAIVSGQITPDSYVVDKRDFSIIDINIAEQKKMLVKKPGSGNVWKDVHCRRKECQKLNGQQIIALAKLCLQIEKHYGKPQDIEWAFAGGKFYITQSRPITTL